jgi:hypothetical protein
MGRLLPNAWPEASEPGLPAFGDPPSSPGAAVYQRVSISAMLVTRIIGDRVTFFHFRNFSL